MQIKEQLFISSDEEGQNINFRLFLIAFFIIFIAIFSFLFILDNLYKIREKCGTQGINLSICKLNTFHLIALMLLLISAGLIIVITVTIYILIKGTERV